MRFIRAADDWLLSVRDRLSPGQRWTAVILMALTLAVLAFGSPTKTVTVPGRDVAAPLSSPVAASPIDVVRPAPDALAAVPLVETPAETPPPAESTPTSDAPPPAPPADDPPAPPACAADQGLPTPLFSMIVALLRGAQPAVADALAGPAGCGDATAQRAASAAAAVFATLS